MDHANLERLILHPTPILDLPLSIVPKLSLELNRYLKETKSSRFKFRITALYN